MKSKNKLLLVFVCVFASTAFAVYKVQTVPELVKATNVFLASLTPEQQAKVRFTFTDQERLNFHFTPVARKGISLKQLSPSQEKLAYALLSAGVSQRGYIKATTIMSLEQILADLEGPNRRIPRDPDEYFFSVFGEPSETGVWGLRIEGHHLTLNFTMDKGKMVAQTPAFMGANPAEVKEGPRKGLRTLAGEEDLGRALVLALDPRQQAEAVIEPKAPSEIISAEKLTYEIGAPKGLPLSKLTAKQMEALMALIEEYAYRMPNELATATMNDMKKPVLDKVYFAWAGGLKRGEQHYYRLHGPSFLIEYDNTQNNGNHIHSVWRDLKNDFGMDVLREHYRTDHQK